MCPYEVVIPAETDKDGNILIPQHKETQPILNPEWDNTKEYIPRSKRPEWVAAASSKGYRVLKRTGPNQILILYTI